jgi:RNA polymerase sigma-70 factor (ECF subfamily)
MRKGKPYSEYDDEMLVRKTLKGEREAFSELVKRYQGKAYGIAMGILGNREDALDVVQDSFIKAYNSLSGFRFSSKFFTWFYRLLVNRSIDRLRSASRGEGLSFDETWMKEDGTRSRSMSEYTDGPLEAIQKGELREVIRGAIESLPEHQRAVVVLREVEGLSYEEIARVLDISTGTVMSRLHYARGRLREIIGDYVREE